ncbi:MAG TPA: hypothetical protein VKW70_07410, partial [Terriglobia bacterium]|nr:hypothetical protein [Terriglobia bacterium]
MHIETSALAHHFRTGRGPRFQALWLAFLFGISWQAQAQQGCFIPPEFRNPQTTLTIRADSQEKVKDI